MRHETKVNPNAPEHLREALHGFVRRFGLLSQDATPCGKPLATSHAHALMFLRKAGDSAPTQQALGQALGIDKSNVARLCAKMAQDGHLLQSPSPTDGRARCLQLTERGQRLADEVEAASRARFAALLAAVPGEMRAPLLTALQVLNTAVEQLAHEEERT